MAALAYVLLPISGLVAYFTGRSSRMRLHGLQAVALGAAWPAALYGCSAISPGAAQVAWAVGGVVWLALMGAAAVGRDLRLPVIGSALQRVAAVPPKDR
jgi:uncharacterized membrane protein